MTLLSSLYEASVTLTPKFQCHETILEVMDNCKTMQVQSNIWRSINLQKMWGENAEALRLLVVFKNLSTKTGKKRVFSVCEQ